MSNKTTDDSALVTNMTPEVSLAPKKGRALAIVLAFLIGAGVGGGSTYAWHQGQVTTKNKALSDKIAEISLLKAKASELENKSSSESASPFVIEVVSARIIQLDEDGDGKNYRNEAVLFVEFKFTNSSAKTATFKANSLQVKDTKNSGVLLVNHNDYHSFIEGTLPQPFYFGFESAIAPNESITGIVGYTPTEDKSQADSFAREYSANYYDDQTKTTISKKLTATYTKQTKNLSKI